MCDHHISMSHKCVQQLAVAVADLALYMEDWKNVPLDLMHNFGFRVMIEFLCIINVALGSHHLMLLDILVALPEEIDNKNLRIDVSPHVYCNIEIDVLMCLLVIP
jgi:hypothetical protein